MISVIIPTFNREKTILRAIDSVLSQTYKDIELIIVDDGSTDNTKDIVESIDDIRIKYIFQKNSGAAEARNTGIKNAQGKYIAFQDSDDYWYPDKLEKQLAYLEDNEADIVFCKLKRNNYGNNDICPNLREGQVDYENILTYPSVSTQTLFGKSQVFKDNLFDYKLPALEDYAFSICTFEKYIVFHMKEVLVELYLQEDSLTANMKKYIEANKLIIKNYDEIWERYKVAKAKRLYVIGCLQASVGENDYEAFWESFIIKKDIKTLLKFILAKIGLLSILTHKI